MAAKKEQIPSWFDHWRKPNALYIYKPDEFLEKDIEHDSITYENGDDIELRDPTKFKYKISLDTELDYGGCYYPGEEPSIRVKINIVEYVTEKIPNPNYKQQLKQYDEEMKRLQEWDHWKSVWDAQQSKNEEIAERRLLLKLKKKYEKS